MRPNQKAVWLNIFAWGLAVAVSAIAIISWGQANHWRLAHISTYLLFPVFGLLAFSLMWGHYVIGVIRQIAGVDRAALKVYFEVTSVIVLLAIVMHPGLLSWQLLHDGFGWPPGSYLNNYVAPSLKWAALLGTVSWFVFLAYELRRWFKNKGWWRYAQLASDVAMLAILLHSLTLGRQLKQGWLRGVWLFYGATLILSLFYIYYHKLKPQPTVAKTLPDKS